jgi:hypothetical protein
MNKINKYSFFVIYGIFFLLILCKIILIPVTHDEVATPTHYINFSFWQIMMYPDKWGNNHILNTLIVKIFVYLFGINQVVIRLPNLLAFIVYAIAVFRINKIALKEYSIWFIPASLLFVAYPYFLDFFGLCRGYGLSWSLETLSVSYLLSGFLLTKNRHIWISLSLSILASYANFTLLIFWAANTILIFFYFFSNSLKQLKKLIKPTIAIIIISFFYLALFATPIIKMKSTGQFNYWSSSGIFSGTIITYAILCIIAAYFIYIILWLRKYKNNLSSLKTPVFVSSSILILTAFITIMQCIILKTPSPKGRIALFFFPLIVTSIVCLLGLIPLIKRRKTIVIIAFIISFLCVFNVAYTYSLKYTIQWRFDENTFDVLKYLETQKHPDGTIVLKTDWHYYWSFYFYSYIGKTPWLELRGYDKNIDINTDAEYYYIFSKSYKILESEFEPVYKITKDRWLLKKRPIAIKDSKKNNIIQNE